MNIKKIISLVEGFNLNVGEEQIKEIVLDELKTLDEDNKISNILSLCILMLALGIVLGVLIL